MESGDTNTRRHTHIHTHTHTHTAANIPAVEWSLSPSHVSAEDCVRRYVAHVCNMISRQESSDNLNRPVTEKLACCAVNKTVVVWSNVM